MAVQTVNSSQVNYAQRVYLTKLYDTFQNKADLLPWFEALPNEQINKRGLQIPIFKSANPSLAIGTGDGDKFATAQAPVAESMLVSYVNLNAGLNETYAALLNYGKETSPGLQKDVYNDSARQFASFLNSYASRGNGTAALATVSSNYSGGAPTEAVCNGSTDSIGVSQLVTGGYYLFYDAAGTTQRTGTVGAGAIQLASKSATTATFATNIPSDVVATDIIVPQVRTSNAASAPFGLPYLDNNAGTYLTLSRSSIPGLQSFVRASGGTVTTGMLQETFASVAQRGGYFGNGGIQPLADALLMVVNTGNWNNYLSMTLNSGSLVGGPHLFVHEGSSRPAADQGWATANLTYFGAKIVVANSVRGDEIYFLNPKCLKKAIMKPVGGIIDGMPASDWLQNIDGDGDYLQARLRYMDWWGQFFSPEPYKLGKISGITPVAPTQKATMVYN